MKFRPDREWPGLIALAGLYIFLALAAPRFFAAENLRDLALSNVSVLLVAMGITLVIVVAEIDISVGSLFGVVSIVCGLAAKSGIPAVPLAVVAIGAGAILGAVNGGLVSYVKAPSIVATLATMVAWREALRWTTGGAWTVARRDRNCRIGADFIWGFVVGLAEYGGAARGVCDRL
jgi:rhamnose transport system permease protein